MFIKRDLGLLYSVRPDSDSEGKRKVVNTVKIPDYMEKEIIFIIWFLGSVHT